jgi:hypothetical protein
VIASTARFSKSLEKNCRDFVVYGVGFPETYIYIYIHTHNRNSKFKIFRGVSKILLDRFRVVYSLYEDYLKIKYFVQL